MTQTQSGMTLPEAYYMVEHFRQDSDTDLGDATGCAIFGPYALSSEAETDAQDAPLDTDTLHDAYVVTGDKLPALIEEITGVTQTQGTEILVNDPSMFHDGPVKHTTYLAP